MNIGEPDRLQKIEPLIGELIYSDRTIEACIFEELAILIREVAGLRDDFRKLVNHALQDSEDRVEPT